MPQLPPNADMGKAVKIKQLLKDREQLIEEENTHTWLDAPKAMTALPDGTVVVIMESGRSWRSNGDRWHRHTWAPLPDSPADETFQQRQALTRDLKALGHQEED